ncbi:hypothetical protein [Oceanithermus sp.]|uniref:hypothetical protein n=2 Tax=Oceanithermus sp. TaxID=2268145 RepID=UPI00257F8EF7|nr:hypothetical protein [Oceanithermus sp.]
MDRFKEGDQISITMYLVRRRGDGSCDRAYDAVGKTATLTIIKPGGTDTASVTVTASNDTSRAASMIVHTIAAAATADQRGRWMVVASVDDDELTFGPLAFEVVAPEAEADSCA